MKGESLNVDGIEQKIKTEITDAGDRIKKFADNNSDKFKNTARTAKDVFAFIGKILGLGMILFAVFSIIIVLISWFFPVSSIFVAHPTLNIFCINEMFKFWGISQTASILCMIWSLLPLAGLLLLGIALFLSKMGKKISVFLLSLLGLWIVLSIFLGIGLSSIIAEKKLNAYNETTEMPISSTAQTLLIKPSPTSQFIGKSKTLFGHFLFMNMDQKNRLVYGIPEVWVTSENWVTSSDVTQAFIRVSKRNFQNDYTYKSFNIDIQDSVIYIPTVFGFKNNIWNGERINVEIIVPKGKQVIFDKEFTINDLSGYHYCNDDWD